MDPSPRRSFLLQLLLAARREGDEPTRWEFSPVDEVLLFEFVQPWVRTQGPDFTLFNLLVWRNAKQSALVGPGERQRKFDLTECALIEDATK